ncbi:MULTISPECIES: DUF551 domain-containing protein [unclassified Acinetobacter]|uniref:DUF551 domain-containing protein n=1 Tax=unclassified Acinetobacter TaxID=196816 RepID=UPI00211E8D81|nr:MULTISPECIES: DUF551 domain-containing protein [unclassified Acinetobacter]
MDIQKEKIKQEFWNWAKVENPRVVENAELGDVYATQILDHMFMGFAAAKAQAVPDLGELQERIAGHQYYHDEHGHMIVDMDDVVKEISGFDSWKAQAVPEWISTSERMPNEGEEVFVHYYGQISQATRDKKYSGGFKQRNCYGWESVSSYISHWMPKSIELPEPYHFYYENDAKQKALTEAQEPAND